MRSTKLASLVTFVAVALRVVCGIHEDDDSIAVNCVLSEWSAWTPCLEGHRSRSRYIEMPARGSGTPCEHLVSLGQCSAHPKQAKSHKGHKSHKKGNPARKPAKKKAAKTHKRDNWLYKKYKRNGPDWMYPHNGKLPPTCTMLPARAHHCYRTGGCCAQNSCVPHCDFSIHNQTPAPTPLPEELPTPRPAPHHEHGANTRMARLPAWAQKLNQKLHFVGHAEPTRSPTLKSGLIRLTDQNYHSGSTTKIRVGDYVIPHPPMSASAKHGPLKFNEVGVVDLVSGINGDKPYYVKAPSGRKWYYHKGEIELAPLALIRQQNLRAALSADDLRGLVATPFPTTMPTRAHLETAAPNEKKKLPPTPAPTLCLMSNWGTWSSKCTARCGGGFLIRERKVKRDPVGYAHACPPQLDTKPCNRDVCPGYCTEDPDGDNPVSWGSWGACSRTCGTGLQSRTGNYNFQDAQIERNCPTHQTRKCGDRFCPVMHPTRAPTPRPYSNFNVKVLIKDIHGHARAAKKWVYKGCYNDRPDGLRDLGQAESTRHAHDKMTPYMCFKMCTGYLYFALQHSRLCLCGNTFGRYGRDDDAICSAKCAGSPSSYTYRCGSTASEDTPGQAASSVYANVYSHYIMDKYVALKPKPVPTPQLRPKQKRAPTPPQSVHIINHKPVVRDVHNKLCPASFQPKGGFRSKPGKQACCVLDKALAAIEIIQNIRTCRQYYDRDDKHMRSGPLRTFNHGWLKSGEAPACSKYEAKRLIDDMKTCCAICCLRTCQSMLDPISNVLNGLASKMDACERTEDAATGHLLVAVGTASCAQAEQIAVTATRGLLKAARTMYVLGDPDRTKMVQSVLGVCNNRIDMGRIVKVETKESMRLKLAAGGAMIDMLDPQLPQSGKTFRVDNTDGCLAAITMYIASALPQEDTPHGLLGNDGDPFPQ